ncbi:MULTISPECIES: hypothetical protein [unclassified Idiomarina]|uniref:hypothetical protein n=1 Tax=unclassified Idiomarina TaxID=2614829 RepID=UPI00257F15F9|nr:MULTISPECIES: hypothetical protein [unclassified Idiomarina]
MFNEPNLHSRNLKLISMLFISYWLLGLTPADEKIRLLVINYEISNPCALKWISYALLIYFAWRFNISSRRRVRLGYRRSFNFNNIDRSGRLFIKLKVDAERNYSERYKDEFESWRAEQAEKHDVKEFNNEEYSINPSKLVYEQNSVALHYQVQYKGDRLPGNDFKNGMVVYPWYRWSFLKLVRFTKFIFGSEDAPDFFVPWVLFSLALASSALSYYGVSVHDFG